MSGSEKIVEETPEKHLYRMLYLVLPELSGIGKDEVEEHNKETGRDYGACDAVLLFSLVFPGDGGTSIATVSQDGRTGKLLSSKDMFVCWLALAEQLMSIEELPDWQKLLCQTTVMSVQSIMEMLRNKAATPENLDPVDED